MQKNIFGATERDGEDWAIIEETGGKHMVSSHGRVWSRTSQKMLFQGECESTYLILSCGPDKSATVHHLVMKYHGGEKPSEDAVINHRDGDKHNNHIDNLEWVSARENRLHGALRAMIRERSPNYVRQLLRDWVPEVFEVTGSGKRGRPQSLGEIDLRKAVRYRRRGDSVQEIAEKLGSNKTTVMRRLEEFCRDNEISIHTNDPRERDFGVKSYE